MIDYPYFPGSDKPSPCFEENMEHEWKIKLSSPYNQLYWCINCGGYQSLVSSSDYDCEVKFYKNPALEPR